MVVTELLSWDSYRGKKKMLIMGYKRVRNMGSSIRYELITSPTLLVRLQDLNTKFMDTSKLKGGIFYQRVARVYDSLKIGDQIVPTVYLIKPDQVRYWTRSMALRDADDVVADALLWRNWALPGIKSDTEPVRA
jgi:hypothetical protein